MAKVHRGDFIVICPGSQTASLDSDFFGHHGWVNRVNDDGTVRVTVIDGQQLDLRSDEYIPTGKRT